jgi:hypothetical protein
LTPVLSFEFSRENGSRPGKWPQIIGGIVKDAYRRFNYLSKNPILIATFSLTAAILRSPMMDDQKSPLGSV